MTQRIPESLLNLIEHVELRQSGWWDEALGNVLLGALWLDGQPKESANLRDLIQEAFGLNIPSDRISTSIDKLIGQGKLLVDKDGRITTTETVGREMAARVQAAQRNEIAVSTAFVEKIQECCSPHSPEEAWLIFVQTYLLPLIDLLGARTLQLMGGHEIGDGDAVALADNFVKEFNADIRESVRRVVGEFLDPANPQVRTYVAEHMNASFLVKASGLTAGTIAEISQLGKKPPSFHLFLDTNFLFSLLDLHENPSNEAAQLLGSTVQQARRHLNVRMHVISPTMDEFKRTLWASKEGLRGMSPSTPLASAALDVGISGIELRYLMANAEATRPISVDEYFDPFQNNLTPILRARGVEVYNKKTVGYRSRQDVIDGLNELISREGSTENERQRIYNAALHDSMLWHFVEDRRPNVFESPMEAGYWVVTNDYRLLSFDRRRRLKANSVAGVCIHPAELLQILRLWEPRDTDMEVALMSGLRLPFMFYEFDPVQESVSIRILKALSRFDHVKYLDSEAIRDIVLNDDVRTKTASAADQAEENTIVREALLAERDEIARQRDAANARTKLLEEELARQKEETQRASSANRETGTSIPTVTPDVEQDLTEYNDRVKDMERRIQDYEAILSEKAAEEEAKTAIVRAILVRGLAGAIVAALAAASTAIAWASFTQTSLAVVSAATFLAWCCTLLVVLTAHVQDTRVSEWRPMAALLSMRRAAVGIVLTLLMAIVADAITDLMDWPRWLP